MLLAHSPTKLLITGNSGSGKSTFATAYVLGSPQGKVFVFDHEGEFSFRLGVPPEAVARDTDELLKALDGRWIIFDPSRLYPGDTAAAFEFFGEWVFQVCEHLSGTKLFFSDEIQTFVDNHDAPWALRALLETGRRRGIDTALVTQQPNVIHNTTRNQLTEIVAFSQVDANAVKFLEDVGFDGDELRSLAPGQFVARGLRTRVEQRGAVNFGAGTIELFSKVTQPPADTVPRSQDSSAADGARVPRAAE